MDRPGEYSSENNDNGGELGDGQCTSPDSTASGPFNDGVCSGVPVQGRFTLNSLLNHQSVEQAAFFDAVTSHSESSAR